MEILPELEWEGLLEKLKQQRGTAILIGATDSGKSTLTKYLVEKLIRENIKVSVVDADIGQSTLGLPGTISMRVFSNEKDIENFRFERMFFVGSTNPAKRISMVIDGSKRMVDFCKEKSEIIIVDTTGLISGEIGRALKIGKIRAIKPEHIIAVRRNDELEHILNLIEGISIHRIRTSSLAKGRDRENRVHYRKKKFLDYFDMKEISEFLLNQNDVRFFYNSKPFNLREGDFKKGTIIGLNHDADTMGLGAVVEIIDDSVIFKSPIKSLKGINRVLFGDMDIL
ncbi:MAG: Clp1/GlmU family protein [Nitrospirota bacterium]